MTLLLTKLNSNHQRRWLLPCADGRMHLTDSVTMLTKEGFELRHEVFLHDAPAPAEPEEVVEE